MTDLLSGQLHGGKNKGDYMTKAGKDVTLIARGAHLQAMQENGLTLEKCDKASEIRGLVYDAVKMGATWGCPCLPIQKRQNICINIKGKGGL